jgi:hypothetical protein
MIDIVEKVMNNLDPVSRKTNPVTAAVVGFLFGGIGLAFFFRTIADTVLLAIMVVLVCLDTETSLAVQFTLMPTYAYLRSNNSNARLLQTAQSSPA